MKTISLKKNQSFCADGKFFIIRSGKVITKDILETGKALTNETYFSEGEIVGNFLKFLSIEGFKIPEIEVEITAMEDNTVLEEFNITEKHFQENFYLQKFASVLLKKVLIKFFYQLYDTKGYLLSVLKLYKRNKKCIYRNELHYENLNISKSQFYLTYNKLREENYLLEINSKIYLNSRKVERYLNLFGEAV